MAYIDQDDYWQEIRNRFNKDEIDAILRADLEITRAICRGDEYADLYAALDLLESALRPVEDSVLDAEHVIEDVLDAEEIG